MEKKKIGFLILKCFYFLELIEKLKKKESLTNMF